MDSLLKHLYPGLDLYIQRSNGMVHSAKISELHAERSSVSVMWNEKGVSKGKEVLLDEVFAVNPDLLQKSSSFPGKDTFPLEKGKENVVVLKRWSTISKILAPKEVQSCSTRLSVIPDFDAVTRAKEMEVDVLPRAISAIPGSQLSIKVASTSRS
ncbi:kinesin-like protein KIF2C [Latimeria chalumnae]|uniref:kinesin-like protein KIF2C n=1 Tax=Latimeria chalumnae TaxID=7897 RepID=UPI00313D6923